MPVWPVTLPDKPLYDGYAEQPPDNRLRTQMDVGPPKQRRRATAGVRKIQCQFRLTKAQTEILDNFYDVICASGSLTFDWTHPRTGAAVVFTFGKTPPSHTVQADDVWLSRVELEIWP